MNTPVENAQRYSSREGRPCPVCGGGADDPRGEDVRCIGFVSSSWARCSRRAVGKPADDGTSVHRLLFACRCGVTHQPPSWWTPTVTRFNYIENDAVVGTKTRWDWPMGPKDMNWDRKSLNGRAPATLPFYGASVLPKDITTVVLVEGEKKCDQLVALGIPAVATGTGAPGTHDVDAFKDLLDYNVILWGDDDEKGRQQRRANAARLREIGHPNVKELRDGTPAPDDYLTANPGAARALALLDQAMPIASGSGSGLLTVLSEIQAEKVPWVWAGYIPRGMPTLIVGEPGTNKSTMLIDYAAKVTTGRLFPGEVGKLREPEVAIYLSAEDSAAYTIKPRFLAAGGDPSRLFVLNVNADGFNLEKGIPQLEAAIRDVDAKHLLVDPVNAFLPTTDSWKDTAIRSALRPLRDLAERMNIPVISIMHLNKKTEQSGLNRINGSVAYGAMARAVYLIAKDPDDESLRQFHCLKPSVMKKPAALRFSLTPTEVTDNGGEPINTVALTWDIQTPITTTTEELLRPLRKGKKGVEDGTELVARLMVDGPMLAVDLVDQLVEAGLTRATAVRAMQKATSSEKAPGAKDSPWYRTPYGWNRAQFEAWWRSRSKERE